MNANDIFELIGDTPEEYVLDAASFPLKAQKPRRLSVGRIALIAAAAVLMLALMGSAVAKLLVTMEVSDVAVHVHTGGNNDRKEPATAAEETTEATRIYEGERVDFEKVGDDFIELGPWYPQQIPEGYTMTFVSEGAPLQSQTIHYENGAEGYIYYWIYIGDPASGTEIYGIRQKTAVKVNGLYGILYDQEGGGRTLVWVDESLGYGFTLSTNDSQVDLLAMAESTAEGEYLVPSRSDKTQQALEELGDFSPSRLPEGFVEQGTMGSPIAEGGGWYSYVRRWYVNREENEKIYLEYESYRIITEEGYTDDARTVCSFFIPGYKILENKVVGQEVEIGGMFGIADRCHIAWADPQTHRVFHLYSADVTGEDLLEVARSICENG